MNTWNADHTGLAVLTIRRFTDGKSNPGGAMARKSKDKGNAKTKPPKKQKSSA